jgi:hypothetical protein
MYKVVGSRYLVHMSTSKNQKSYFQVLKKLKKYSDVANNLSHKHAKNHVQILCILGYIEMKIYKSEYAYFKSTNFILLCNFCVAHNTKNFVSKFCMLCVLHIDYV